MVLLVAISTTVVIVIPEIIGAEIQVLKAVCEDVLDSDMSHEIIFVVAFIFGSKDCMKIFGPLYVI